ncbi:hypothetical protein AB833_13650 [Chromatiales bacterium (ex Bugula neritina AB1)]|nr:hypothetical protein AB833_13650 [Chromatiales bacterium (ex Bugula neritina AB1)]
MSYPISEQQCANFARDGAVVLPGLLAEHELEATRASLDRALDRSDNYFRRLRAWEDDPHLRYLCCDSHLPAVVAVLLDTSKVNLFYDQVFTKEPASAAATPWHNDQPYWPVRGAGVMTLWLALDDISMESGPLEFIAGSHRWDRWFKPFVAASDGSAEREYEAEAHFEPLPDFDSQRQQHSILCWELQAGDAIAFHALSVHAAKPNISSTRRRRGYAVRYAGADVSYHEGPANNPRLLNPDLQHGDPLDSKQYPVVFGAN